MNRTHPERGNIMHTVPEHTADRLVARMQKEHGFSEDVARAVLNETLVFLNMIAENPGCPSSPSTIVDIGWHTFILYTREYSEFCQRAAGRFIHHCPTDTPELRASSQTSQATVEFMATNGIVFDPEMWVVAAFCNVRGTGCQGKILPAEVRTCDGYTLCRVDLHYHDATSHDVVMSGTDCDDGRGNCKSCGGGLGNCS